MPNVQDRDALYYPYIHIRDHQINWLKATLLCFPQVRRIVPGDFHLNDPAAVAPFRNVKGARGEPLLGEEYTDYHFDSSPIANAQHTLLAMMKDNAALVAERYSQASTRHELGDEADSFEMHAGKMLAPLHDHLLSHDLGWYSRRTVSNNGDNRWVTLHPTLGEAIMSLIAIAIARDAKLDIVTSSSEMHHALAVQDINEVLDLLLGRYPERKDASVDEKVDELAEVVMTTFFDLDKLTAEQIAELQKEGKDLGSAIQGDEHDVRLVLGAWVRPDDLRISGDGILHGVGAGGKRRESERQRGDGKGKTFRFDHGTSSRHGEHATFRPLSDPVEKIHPSGVAAMGALRLPCARSRIES